MQNSARSDSGRKRGLGALGLPLQVESAAKAVGLSLKPRGRNVHLLVPVENVDLQTEKVIQTYASLSEATVQCGLSRRKDRSRQ